MSHPEESTLNVALIGCGIWGKVILSELLDLGCDVEVFDKNAQAVSGANFSNRNFRWNTVDSVPANAQLRDCNAVIIATPASVTPKVLEHVLDLKIPVFVEKPLALHVEQLKFLDPEKHHYVKPMHIWRYHPAVEAIRGIVKAGTLGQLLGIRTFRCGWTSPRRDVDTLWNLSFHDLTISLEILGYIPETKYAAAEFHDGAIRGAFIALGNSPYHWIELSNRHELKNREVRIHGTDGIATWKGDDEGHISLYMGDADAKECSYLEIPYADTSALRRQLIAFTNYVRGGASPKSDLQEAIDLVNRVTEIKSLVETP